VVKTLSNLYLELLQEMINNLKVLLCCIGLAGLMLGGCGKSDAISDMEKMTDEICACKDKECVEAVMKKGESLKEKHKDFDPEKLSEGDQKRMAAVTTKMVVCAMKFEGGGEGGE